MQIRARTNYILWETKLRPRKNILMIHKLAYTPFSVFLDSDVKLTCEVSYQTN